MVIDRSHRIILSVGTPQATSPISMKILFSYRTNPVRFAPFCLLRRCKIAAGRRGPISLSPSSLLPFVPSESRPRRPSTASACPGGWVAPSLKGNSPLASAPSSWKSLALCPSRTRDELAVLAGFGGESVQSLLICVLPPSEWRRVGGHAVLDISSDEEGLVPDAPKGGGGESYDWVSELLGVDDLITGDLDEVVVVKEVSAKSKPNKLVADDDDDDCVVLDGDPEKAVSAPDDAVDGGSDDLLIVGEKGQVACRDYPHPRHDCVIFPFSSTLHEKHCNLCHCYVCDSPAPCAYWGKDQVFQVIYKVAGGTIRGMSREADSSHSRHQNSCIRYIMSFRRIEVKEIITWGLVMFHPLCNIKGQGLLVVLWHCSPNLIGVSSSMTPSQVSSDGQGSNQSLSGQNIHQHHSQPSAFPSFSDSLSWINEFLQADDKPSAQPAVESIHVPSTEPAHEAQPARDFNTVVAESFDIGATGVDFENWWPENPPPENNFAPVPAAADAGMLLFDFENFWNGVTQP
ncbi:hypothetical protein NL676_001388 [Syzygium grande]|nr:hypothetical protein NL676_001388 [Syzygium grande]